MNAQSAYDQLTRCSREQTLLGSCSALLGWDEQTYMPAGGAQHRGELMAYLAGLHHEKATDPRIGEWLSEAEQSDLVADPVSPAAVNIREWRRSFDRLTRLPRTLVEEMARTTSLAQQEWIEARKGSDFERFRHWLAKIVGLKQREAECLSHGGPLYDALLDEYEPGAKSREIANLFAALKAELVPLVAAIAGATRRPDGSLLQREYPVDRQRVFGEAAASAVGFDFQKGRLDTTAHPFCTGIGPGDCRITTRFDARCFSDAFFGILHETGHGLYDQGLAPEHYGTPMGEAVSLGVHESQSRLWENAVGRSLPFWEHFFPLARQVFHETLHDVTLDAFHFAINHVAPSLIRVQADEVTYNLHILIRFELEQSLLSGDLAVEDLPGTWHDHYFRALGVAPRNDAEGCLQDIHWSAGLFGYFPTYTLGNLFAAQLMDQARHELGDLDAAFAQCEFQPLLGWLRAKVHRHGRRYHAPQLIAQATGRPPDHQPLVNMLRQKYGALYGL
ncbi:MAG: carboxypeptidase M32 [Isosphaeraceae bacterium]|nr:carboxypeptidase M32 [Isosphaeraceae bacterium]